ncbi:TetR/AcrR family transcriptional regulator [Actinoplanes sp. NPDC049548]|uniref:TetR/AcrR family transcriptional regulator n=1 Tax=Actinoplanes sp. NPDC049548 TaxID=3155152 RepID=UPI00341B6098
MRRLSRTESRERTREQLLETARLLFLRDGYHATSLEKVAEAAGFSKGAVYSNFRSKDELCLAVLEQLEQEELAAVAAALAAGDTWAQRADALRDWAEHAVGDAGWTLLGIELAVQARRDPVLRDGLVRKHRAAVELLAAALAGQFDRDGRRPALPVPTLAAALLDLAIGLAIGRSLDPQRPVDTLTETLQALVGSDPG